jgi:GT2 family glycosyltransferase
VTRGAMVDVIIPNFNGLKYLSVCLDSLTKQTVKDFQITLVDDASTDDSVSYVRTNYPFVNVIALPKNRGFAPAVNEGIRRTEAELVFLLNNDTEVDSRCIEELVLAFEEGGEIAIAAPKVLIFDRRDIIESTGILYRVDGASRGVGLGHKDSGDFGTSRLVFGASAGAAMYRRSLLDEIGLLDEDFKFYYEDTDLSFRALLRGRRCLYVPGAVVYHHWGHLRHPDFTLYYTTRNVIYLLIKDLPSSLLIRYLPYILLYQAYLSFVALIKGKTLIDARAKFDALRNLPVMMKKRREIQKTRTVGSSELGKIIVHKLERAKRLKYE